VYISRVEEGSIAESVGLKPGDSILEVNGRPFSTISHEEALKVLRLKLLIRNIFLNIFLNFYFYFLLRSLNHIVKLQ